MDASVNGQSRTKQILNAMCRVNNTLHSFGLNFYHCYALLLVQETPGILPGKLFKILGILPASVTRALNHLENAQLIERKIGIPDHRRLPCYITEKGVELLKKIELEIPVF